MSHDFVKLRLPEKTAIAKSAAIKSSVQKAMLVASLIKGMRVSDALLQLEFCKRRVAKDIMTVLGAAISNAENNFGYDIDKLYVSRITANKAFNLKRMRMGARGRGRGIKKYYSTVSICVSEV